GLALGYLVRAVPRGLADALDAAWPWLGDADVCLALPDTLVTPADALARVRAERSTSGADVVLGVFPTDRPEQLGPVRVADDGAGERAVQRVDQVHGPVERIIADGRRQDAVERERPRPSSLAAVGIAGHAQHGRHRERERGREAGRRRVEREQDVGGAEQRLE